MSFWIYKYMDFFFTKRFIKEEKINIVRTPSIYDPVYASCGVFLNNVWPVGAEVKKKKKRKKENEFTLF